MEQVIRYEVPNSRIKLLQNKYVYYFSFFAISFFLPLVLLIAVNSYAQKFSIHLESGCQGPEMFFGLLSGVLMALQLKHWRSYES